MSLEEKQKNEVNQLNENLNSLETGMKDKIKEFMDVKNGVVSYRKILAQLIADTEVDAKTVTFISNQLTKAHNELLEVIEDIKYTEETIHYIRKRLTSIHIQDIMTH